MLAATPAPVVVRRRSATWQQKAQAERARRGWSYVKLGEEMRPPETDGRQVSRWLQGQHAPRPEIVERIAEALGLPVAYLLSKDESHLPTMEAGEAATILRGLPPEAYKIVNALADAECRAYLSRAVDEFYRLRRPGAR